jgi:uncharacterized coiled-coil DUF342 family protein
MITKINNQIKDSLKKERDTHYIFSDDFFKEVDGITEKEDEVAQKLMSIIGSDKDDQDEIILCVETKQIYHFSIWIQRQISLMND